tara:strand:+ start:31082 stop:31285 length:204 start_codon:yes stop_codon:yes gene_type:complete
MKFIVILLVFILLNGFLIVSNNELYLKNGDAWGELGELYVDWLKKVAGNGAEITGEAVKMNWISEEG